ncbi:hypothetical protein VOLCADRAFT_102702 [Volvox carteri f. nagariensis]|uniref:ADP-ribosylation/Crystallin J1 n=1 Tax=Volvox carteri f. nagariensis TaxID=3068 RepID=D8THJ3_VOLCA|nr:uncharacterized protein VOLCADRAFT_102702 [Volvox carteri f. nagariensis]EFJ53080.1 hypothetical protein VOLCADRAFT_102702 [Volvox carteri f. nagariensis]|eukprot:XP_002946085.1 hypothetical protein VOLCADRAFT_102702 [Volvox carteri f. nagariensis]
MAAPATTMADKANVKERAKAAILGGLLADAASMPLHWIYDVPKIQDLLASKSREATPEFFPEPSCPFYKHPYGSLSPYGHELIPLLRSMAENGGELDENKYGEAMYGYFTAEEPDAYRNRSVRSIVAGWEEGKRGKELGDKDDFQANCFAKASLLVARYAGKPELREKMEAAVRVQQNNDQAVAYGMAGALLLEKVVLGQSVSEALSWAVGEGGLQPDMGALVERALATRTQPLRELTYEPVPYMVEMVSKHMALRDSLSPFALAVWCNGPACGNPAAFTNVAMAAAQYGNSYVDAVRANMLAGGDNCSRSLLIGALLAAEGGMSCLPREWTSQVPKWAQYEELVDRLLAAPTGQYVC